MLTLLMTARGIMPAASIIPAPMAQNRNAMSSGSLMAVRKRTMERAPTKGQDNIGSHGRDDRCRNHGQGNQSGAEACGIHHAPVGFLVNKENEQTNAKGQQDGQNHVKDTDRGYFF